MAVPSFTAMIERNRSTTYINEFTTAINLARSEALKVGGTVSVQATNASDSANEFGNGWCVVEGNPGNCNGNVAAGTMIRKFDALVGETTLNSVDDVSSMQFDGLGALSNTGDNTRSFDLCYPGQDGRRIFISLIGRAKTYRVDASPANRPAC